MPLPACDGGRRAPSRGPPTSAPIAPRAGRIPPATRRALGLSLLSTFRAAAFRRASCHFPFYYRPHALQILKRIDRPLLPASVPRRAHVGHAERVGGHPQPSRDVFAVEGVGDDLVHV